MSAIPTADGLAEALALSPDLGHVAALYQTDDDKSSLRVYETVTGEMIAERAVRSASHLSYSPDGEFLLCDCWHEQPQVGDRSESTQLAALDVPAGYAVAWRGQQNGVSMFESAQGGGPFFSSDGRYVVHGGSAWRVSESSIDDAPIRLPTNRSYRAGAPSPTPSSVVFLLSHHIESAEEGGFRHFFALEEWNLDTQSMRVLWVPDAESQDGYASRTGPSLLVRPGWEHVVVIGQTQTSLVSTATGEVVTWSMPRRMKDSAPWAAALDPSTRALWWSGGYFGTRRGYLLDIERGNVRRRFSNDRLRALAWDARGDFVVYSSTRAIFLERLR